MMMIFLGMLQNKKIMIILLEMPKNIIVCFVKRFYIAHLGYQQITPMLSQY